MRTNIFFFAILQLIAFNSLAERIKSAAYWTAPTLTIKQAESLANYDLLIIDFENAVNNRGALELIKKLNPAIKLLAYSNPFEIWDQDVSDRPRQQGWIKRIRQSYPDWLLKTDQGNKVVFYAGMRLTNMTSSCPRYLVPGLGLFNFNDWMSHLLLSEVLSDRIWDGYFMDNSGGNISWINDRIDSDLDRVIDRPDELDRRHSEGVRHFLKIIRDKKGKDFILIGNKGSVEFIDILDGRMFEFFPNDYLGDRSDFGFWQSLVNAKQTGKYTIILVRPSDSVFGYAAMRLLGNQGYLAIGHNNPDYDPLYLEDFGSIDSDKISIEIRMKGGRRISLFPGEKKANIHK